MIKPGTLWRLQTDGWASPSLLNAPLSSTTIVAQNMEAKEADGKPKYVDTSQVLLYLKTEADNRSVTIGDWHPHRRGEEMISHGFKHWFLTPDGTKIYFKTIFDIEDFMEKEKGE
jgi:hypothetical protein